MGITLKMGLESSRMETDGLATQNKRCGNL